MNSAELQTILERKETERELHNCIIDYYISGRLTMTEVLGQLEQTKHIMLSATMPKED